MTSALSKNRDYTAVFGWRMLGGAQVRALPTVETSHEDQFLKAFDEYADALFRHAHFRLSDRERALDATQETYIKAWEYVRSGKEIRHWRSFLYRVLNNLIVDEYRRKKEQSLDALFENDPVRANEYTAIDGRMESETRLDDAILIEKIQALIPQLPEQQRVVIVLRYIDGFSPKEIALSLGISENAASVRLHRAIDHLKKLCGNLITT